MQRIVAALAALFVLTLLTAGAALAGPTAVEEDVPVPACRPTAAPAGAVQPIAPVDPPVFTAAALAGAPIGTMMVLPEGKYQEPPMGLKCVNLPVSVAYTAPDGAVTRIQLIENAEYRRPGLVFTVTGKLNGEAVVLNYVCHHLESRVVDVPVQGQVPQKQSVPYLCAWGPITPKVSDLAERCIRIVAPVEPAPTLKPAPNPAAAAAPKPAPSTPAVPAAPAPAPARPSNLVESDDPTPAPPNPALATARRDGALARVLVTKSVGETMVLPDWATAAPTKAPEGWGNHYVKYTYKTGQVVALVKRQGDRPIMWVRAVVVGTGDEPDADGQTVRVSYVWAPTSPLVDQKKGERLRVSNVVPPDCPGSAPPQYGPHDHNN